MNMIFTHTDDINTSLHCLQVFHEVYTERPTYNER